MYSVRLMVAWLCVGGVVLNTYALTHVDGLARWDGFHARWMQLVVLLTGCCLGCLYQGSSGSIQKQLKSYVQMFILMLQISSSIGLLIPDIRHKPRVTGIHESTQQSDVNCETSNGCIGRLNLNSKLLIKSGHGINILMEGDKHKAAGRIEIKQADTNIIYTPDVILPYYQMSHAFVSKKHDDDYNTITTGMKKDEKSWEKFRTHAGAMLAPTMLATDQEIVVVTDERQITGVSDKWKCGEWLSDDDTVKQAYAITPEISGGYIQWTTGGEISLNLTVCVTFGKEYCQNREYTVNEGIVMEVNGISIMIERETPRVPAAKYLLSRYSIADEKLRLNEWRTMSRGLRGLKRFGDIGGVQSSCIPTSTSSCRIGSFDPKNIMDWNLMQNKASSPKPQNGIITGTILAIIAIVAIAGAAVGGSYAAQQSNKCDVKYKSVTNPAFMDELASEYASVDEWESDEQKIMPDSVGLIKKDNELFPSSVVITLVDYDKQLADVQASGEHIELDMNVDPVIEGLSVESCTVSLSGGLGICRIKVTSMGEGGLIEVSTEDKNVIIVTGIIDIKSGTNVYEVGIEGQYNADDRPSICLGPETTRLCSKSKTLDVTTNPRITTISADEDTSSQAGGSEWSFKDLWNLLTKWYEKLVLVLLIIASVIFGLVALTMIYRMMKWGILLMSAKSALADTRLGQYELINGSLVTVTTWNVDPTSKTTLETLMNNKTFSVRMAPMGEPTMYGQLIWKSMCGNSNWCDENYITRPKTAALGSHVDNQTVYTAWKDGRPHYRVYSMGQPWLTNSIKLDGVGSKKVWKRVGDFLETNVGMYRCGQCSSKNSFGYCDPLYFPTTLWRYACLAQPVETITSGYLWDGGENGGYTKRCDSAMQYWRKGSARGKTIEELSQMKKLVCKDPGVLIGSLIESEVIEYGRSHKEREVFEYQSARVGCKEDFEMNKDDIVVIAAYKTNVKEIEYLTRKFEEVDTLNKDTPTGWSNCGLRNLGEANDTFPYKNWVIDARIVDEYLNKRIIKRTFYIGPLVLDHDGEFEGLSPVAKSIIYPLQTLPLKSAHNSMAGAIFAVKKGAQVSDEEIKLYSDEITGYVGGAERWEIHRGGSTIILNYYGDAILFIQKGRQMKVSTIDNPRGCMYYNGPRTESEEGGPVRGDCLCVNENAVCVKDDHIAAFRTRCETETRGEMEIEVFRGDYNCYIGEAGINYDGRVVTSNAYMLMSTDNWITSKLVTKGQKITELGNIYYYNNGFRQIYLEESKTECNSTWKCAWERHKGLCILLIALPASFLTLMIVMMISKALVTCCIRTKKMKIANSVGRIADRFISSPDRKKRELDLMRML